MATTDGLAASKEVILEAQTECKEMEMEVVQQGLDG